MELYLVMAITDRAKGESMAAVFRDEKLPLVLTAMGQGTATGDHLSLHGLTATEKAVVSTVATAEEAKRVMKAAKRTLYIDIPGNGIMLTVPIKSVAGARSLAALTDCKEKGGVPKMEFSHELIVVILNEGYADDVMDAARAAGAGGGTVLHAKGTGRGRAESFFGVSLAEEKDMIYIVANAGEKAQIMKAIQTQAGPGTKPGAICFSLPISAVAGLRERVES